MSKIKKVSMGMGAILGLCQMISIYYYRKVFFVRCPRDIPFWQYGVSHFPNLRRVRVEFQNNRNVTLRGYLYHTGDAEKPVAAGKRIIILVNGYLQSHQDYMTDIAHFADCGFAVFGFDNMGCYESDGESMRGLDQAVLDLESAIKFLERITEENAEIYLYGHSMGAYACAMILTETKQVKRVLLRSGFSDSTQMMSDALSTTYGRTARIMAPFLYLYRCVLFPELLFRNTLSGLRKTKAEVLILHCADDTVVPLKHSLWCVCRRLLHKENIARRLFYGRGHDVARDRDAIRYYFVKERERLSLQDRYGEDKVPKKLWQQYMDSVDKVRINAYDASVLSMMSLFFEQGL